MVTYKADGQLLQNQGRAALVQPHMFYLTGARTRRSSKGENATNSGEKG
ncbi:MAG: hypothetical protein OXC63_11870 [Aestuariivita sp.]|nr:hypothetical protein [Aestuariivita sp.]